jgi:hypothetical protein
VVGDQQGGRSTARGQQAATVQDPACRSGHDRLIVPRHDTTRRWYCDAAPTVTTGAARRLRPAIALGLLHDWQLHTLHQ